MKFKNHVIRYLGRSFVFTLLSLASLGALASGFTSGSATLGTLGFESAPHDLFSVRVNSLNALTQKILPDVIFQAHLNNEHLPDHALYHTQKWGYDVSVDLKNIDIQLPPNSKPQIDGSFGNANRFLINLLLPEITATTDVTVSLIPSHFWEPKIIKKFNLKVTGFTASGSITLGAQDGDLIATTYDIVQTEVSRVDIENLGLLKDLLNEWVSLTDACKDAIPQNSRAVCNSFDDYLTLKSNAFLTSVIKDQIMGSMKDSLIAKLKAAATASFSFDSMNMAFALKLDGFHTEDYEGLSSGIFDWKIWTKSTLAADPCAAKLPTPDEESTPFHWPTRTQGDLEIALNHTFIEQVLYSVAQQGLLCGNDKGNAVGLFPYEIDTGPSGPIHVEIQNGSSEKEKVFAQASGPMSLNIHSLPGDLVGIQTNNSSFLAHAGFIPSVDAREVTLNFAGSSVTDVQGDLDVIVLPFPMVTLQGEIESDLHSILQKNVSVINVLHSEIDINQFMKARVEKDLRVKDGQLLLGIDFVPGETSLKVE